jgi:hypothetical protein
MRPDLALPVVLGFVGSLQLLTDIGGHIADFGLHLGFRDALTLGHLQAAADQFVHILRRAADPILFRGVDAVFDPEIDKVADLGIHGHLPARIGEDGVVAAD